MTRGATIVSFKPYGVDIIGGYDSLADYEEDRGSYQGATVGRVANRIENAEFCMDGAIYMLTDNDGGNVIKNSVEFFHSAAPPSSFTPAIKRPMRSVVSSPLR